MPKKYELRRRERKDSLDRKSPRAAARPAREADAKAAAHEPPSGRRAGRGVALAICGMLVLGTALIFVQTAGHKFVNCDDNEYVYANAYIQRGLTWQCVKWAVTEAHSANWHPLTWMSLAVDWQLYGKWDPELDRYVDSWPGGHHLVNMALHAICAVLLFLTLQAMTGATWPSAFVAAIFAIHPLHVESVAWATGRKDTLSALFFLLALAAYYSYAIRPFSWWRYALVAVSFVLGLASKPMLVTVPFVLLLLDFWPLRRILGVTREGDGIARILLEKLPLLALSAGSCFLTTWAQGTVGAFKPLDFKYRLGNALISYASYIGQMIWPTDMAVQYVHAGPLVLEKSIFDLPLLSHFERFKPADQTLQVLFEQWLLAAVMLAAVTLAVAWFGWRRRYLIVGWLWYVGMLVPVIGLVQVGAQARADRYTYITQIGLYIMIAWGLGDALRAWRWRPICCAAGSVPLIAALAAVAWLQTSHWQNSLTLWEHGVACQPRNDYALSCYGDALTEVGRTDEANASYRKSFEVNAKYLAPRFQLAGNLYKQGKAEEALQVCDEALQEIAGEQAKGEEVAHDQISRAHFLRAIALYGLGQADKSIGEFKIALSLNPKNEQAENDLAEVLRNKNRLDEAQAHCAAALKLNPEFPEAQRTMGNILLAKGDLAGAEQHFRTALKFKAGDLQSIAPLATVLWREGKFRDAIEQYQREMALQPQNLALALEIARELVNDPRPEARFGAEAVPIARRVCEATQYKNVAALDALAAAYAEAGEFDDAEAIARKELETPAGQQPGNAAVLQNRIQLYRMHQKPPISPQAP